MKAKSKFSDETRYNWGFNDGKNAKSFKNPLHKQWPAKGHFDQVYAAGYWAGFNSK